MGQTLKKIYKKKIIETGIDKLQNEIIQKLFIAQFIVINKFIARFF